MHKCAECGFLTVRSKVDSSLVEAAIDFRERAALAIGRDDRGMNQHPLHERIPLCFARQPYLGDATKNIKDTDNPPEEVKKIINDDNDCKGFTKWQLGFTPKEHKEMIDRQWEKKWRVIQGVILVIIAGLFTLLGAYIANI